MTISERPAPPSLVELARNLERSATTGATGDEMLQKIVWAEALESGSRRQLRSSVAAARSHGISWNAIGTALGVSRQAAFKRFDRTGNQTDTEIDEPAGLELIARTEQVFASLAENDYESVRSLMTFACSRELTKRRVMSVWAEMVMTTGRFESCSGTIAQTLDGRNIIERLLNKHLVEGVAIQTHLRHESGEWTGRVAYNKSGKITGILIAVPGTPNLAF